MTTYHRDLVIWIGQVAEALGGARSVGENSVMCCCPGPLHADGDQNPSLQMWADQNIRLKCWVGCEETDILTGIAEAGFPVVPEVTSVKGGAKTFKPNKVAPDEPPPDDWFMASHYFKHRVPDHLYKYHTLQGKTAFYVGRVDADPPEVPKKIVRPGTWVRPKGGSIDMWNVQGYDAPRPIYNIPDLLARLDAPVLVVEGEKTAEAARLLLPDYVVVTWCGGASSSQEDSTNWAPLAGRDVTLWPDNDAAGMKAMRGVVKQIAKGKKAAKSIRMVLTEVEENFPDKFDLADDYLDEYTPLDQMLANAIEIDVANMSEEPVAAEDEEVQSKVKLLMDKYAAVSTGKDCIFVNKHSRSPFRRDMLPYAHYSRSSLELREPETYLTPVPGRMSMKALRYIDKFIESPKKDWFDGIIYDPSTLDRVIVRPNQVLLNLYCGFAFKPEACDPRHYQCFIDHIEASCTKREADYLIDWFAAKFQHPAEMLGTMIILSGRQGCGKTIICDIVNKILGNHNAVKVPMSGLPGQFNSQYANKLMINVEEYDPGASKQQRDLREKVKNLITSTTMLVNAKHVPEYENAAYHSIIATTNSLTPEGISFENRRMTFIRFNNPKLKVSGGVIDDTEYFAPLVKLLLGPPEGLSGLCHYLMTRKVSLGRVMQPLKTDLGDEAKTFVDNPVWDFLRTLADTGVLPPSEDVTTKDNPFPTTKWPEAACIMPRFVLNRMFRAFCKEARFQTLNELQAGRYLGAALPAKASGIADSYHINKSMPWDMINKSGATFSAKDRSLILPNIVELRALVEQHAGERINWSEIEPDVPVSDDKVVDIKTKKPVSDTEQF